MKRIRQILIWILLSLGLLTGCGTQSSATPTADHLVEFDEQGIAMLRGYVVSGTASQDQSISIEVPAEMDSLSVTVNVPFGVQRDTLVASTITKQTDVLEYLSFHHGAAVSDAFPPNAFVEVTFRKAGTGFEAISIQQVEQGFRLFQRTPKIDPLFTMENFAAGTLTGHISQTIRQNDGTLLWRVSMPIMMQGSQVSVFVPVESAPDTAVRNTSGNIAMLRNVGGDVEIRFTRSRDTLIAHQVTLIAP